MMLAEEKRWLRGELARIEKEKEKAESHGGRFGSPRA